MLTEAGALASFMQHAEATAASALLHTPAVSVRSKPKLRAVRRINLSQFSSLTFNLPVVLNLTWTLSAALICSDPAHRLVFLCDFAPLREI